MNGLSASAARRPDAKALCFVLLALAAGSLACVSPAPPPAVQYEPYRAGAPDELTVTILPDPIIEEEVKVRPDGLITIQLLGDVLAGGRTLDEIAKDIEGRISKYKRGARVTVALQEAASAAVTVLGEVRRPGSFSLVKQTRVAEALGNMGGLTIFANTDDVRVMRSRGGTPTVINVDMAAIRKGDMSTNIQVYGGDVVYVPPTVLARIGYAVNMLLFPISPLLGVVNSALGTALVL